MPKASHSNRHQELLPALIESAKLFVPACRLLLSMHDLSNESDVDSLPIQTPDFLGSRYHAYLERQPTWKELQRCFSSKPLRSLKTNIKRAISGKDSNVEGQVPDISAVQALATSEVFGLMRAVLIDVTSRCVFGSPIAFLIREAKQGDKIALKKLVQLDKTVLAAPWATQQIWNAQLRCDWDFLRKIGWALGSNPRSTHRSREVMGATLLLFQPAIEKLALPEIQRFLTETDLCREADEPETIRRFLKRLGVNYQRVK